MLVPPVESRGAEGRQEGEWRSSGGTQVGMVVSRPDKEEGARGERNDGT
jgi:hypothetical protein